MLVIFILIMEIFTLINKLQNAFKDYFEGGLHFRRKDNAYIVEGTDVAINRYDIPREVVKVKYWFSNIWFYIKIEILRGMADESEQRCNISISFFQESIKGQKDQLFRAEWDNYDDNIRTHPQPHWHITSTLAVEKTIEEFKEEDNDYGAFAELFEEEKRDLLNIPAMHFAMAGPWIYTGARQILMNEEEQVIQWMTNLFDHVKAEIDYLKQRN